MTVPQESNFMPLLQRLMACKHRNGSHPILSARRQSHRLQQEIRNIIKTSLVLIKLYFIINYNLTKSKFVWRGVCLLDSMDQVPFNLTMKVKSKNPRIRPFPKLKSFGRRIESLVGSAIKTIGNIKKSKIKGSKEVSVNPSISKKQAKYLIMLPPLAMVLPQERAIQ